MSARRPAKVTRGPSGLVSQDLEAFEMGRLHHTDVPDDREVGSAHGTHLAGHGFEEHLDALALVDSSDDPDELLAGPAAPSDSRTAAS